MDIVGTQASLDETADRLMQDFYLSKDYDPRAKRRADVVKAAMAYALRVRLGSTGSGSADAKSQVVEPLKSPVTETTTELPTEAMWGGLARDLMMWLDSEPKTPRGLFRHLELVGREIPQWLRDEPEMQHLDHVPSKGTRCVLIWKAMEEARLKE